MALSIALSSKTEQRLERLLTLRTAEWKGAKVPPSTIKKAQQIATHEGASAANNYLTEQRFEQVGLKPTKARLLEELIEVALNTLGA